MVQQFQFHHRRWLKTLTPSLIAFFALTTFEGTAWGDNADALAKLKGAQSQFAAGQYFKAARFAFAATENDASYKSEGYSWVTLSLIRAGFPNAALYFFIRTLQGNNPQAKRRVLTQTQTLFEEGGSTDLLRKYLIQNTKYEDYDANNRSAYLYSLGKDALLQGRSDLAVGYFNGIQTNSPLYPYVLQLRGSAYAILGKNDEAIQNFHDCQNHASDLAKGLDKSQPKYRQISRESEDLKARCTAGEARTLYQLERFQDAEKVYDQIPKKSLVWPGILFEQAWNAFARQEYNRTLGKLVSYKSPALKFVFNTENEVLRAQTYLMLCLYNDANESINEFNAKYVKVGEEVKYFVEHNYNNLPAFYEAGRRALHESVYSPNIFYRFMDRFVRSPYFQEIVTAEKDSLGEMSALKAETVESGGGNVSRGFPGFLAQVLKWRVRSLQSLGGAFVKNSLVDYHQSLISDFEKIAFIKLEMLRRAKEKLINHGKVTEDRSRGNVIPGRRDYQYYWSFNGEFWNDELGDYVFGLSSECGKDSAS